MYSRLHLREEGCFEGSSSTREDTEYLFVMERWMKGRCIPRVEPTLVEALG